jgi:hypothetical protein
VQWIKDHGKSMRAAKKPVVHEEYGKPLQQLPTFEPC